MEQITVRKVRLDARRVFNLTAPRWLPEAARLWTSPAAWHSARFDPVRDLLEAAYIDGFNRRTGHYARLEASALTDGIWNPVMLTTGRLLRRENWELPPAVRDDPARVVCEYVGGSRLLVAARLGLEVPAIVNDGANVFPDAEIIPHGSDVTPLFRDKPRRVIWGRDGSLFANFFDYGHFPREQREQRRREQIATRKEVIGECLAVVNNWRIENVVT
jgi:hypothetical protein